MATLKTVLDEPSEDRLVSCVLLPVPTACRWVEWRQPTAQEQSFLDYLSGGPWKDDHSPSGVLVRQTFWNKAPEFVLSFELPGDARVTGYAWDHDRDPSRAVPGETRFLFRHSSLIKTRLVVSVICLTASIHPAEICRKGTPTVDRSLCRYHGRNRILVQWCQAPVYPKLRDQYMPLLLPGVQHDVYACHR